MSYVTKPWARSGICNVCTWSRAWIRNYKDKYIHSALELLINFSVAVGPIWVHKLCDKVYIQSYRRVARTLKANMHAYDKHNKKSTKDAALTSNTHVDISAAQESCFIILAPNSLTSLIPLFSLLQTHSPCSKLTQLQKQIYADNWYRYVIPPHAHIRSTVRISNTHTFAPPHLLPRFRISCSHTSNKHHCYQLDVHTHSMYTYTHLKSTHTWCIHTQISHG
jgi:hypothetical protein